MIRNMLALLILGFSTSLAHSQAPLLFEPENFGKANKSFSENSSNRAALEILMNKADTFEEIGNLRDDDPYRQIGRSIAMLDLLVSTERGPKNATCTATRISSKYVLTNYHCIPGKDFKTTDAKIRFGFLNRNKDAGTLYDVNIEPVQSDSELDFSILRLENEVPLSAFPVLKFPYRDAVDRESLFLIHHPAGQPMRLTRFRCQSGEPTLSDSNDLVHHCDTLGGSSGTAIFALRDRAFVGIHKAGVPDAVKPHNLGTPTSQLTAAGGLLVDLFDRHDIQDSKNVGTAQEREFATAGAAANESAATLLLELNSRDLIENYLIDLRREVRKAMRSNLAENLERISYRQIEINVEQRSILLKFQNRDDRVDAEKRIIAAVRNFIDETADSTFEVFEVHSAGNDVEVKLTRIGASYYLRLANSETVKRLEKRLNSICRITVKPRLPDRVEVQLGSDCQPDEIESLITDAGRLSFHRFDPSVSNQDAMAGLLPPGRIFVPFSTIEGSGRPGLVLFEVPEVTGSMISEASAEPNVDGGGFQIKFSLDSRGTLRMADFSRNNIGSFLAIVLNDKILSVPRINSPIISGEGRITGNFTQAEALSIAAKINAGALPASLKIVDSN